MPQFVGAIDCGTTSCRFFVFDQYAHVIASHQHEYEQHYPQPGWHEQDPQDWISAIDLCIDQALIQLVQLGYAPSDIVTVGFTNQRETTVVWDKISGRILHRAIAWPDTRTTPLVRSLSAKRTEFGTGVDQLKIKTGLPISNYFAALKLRWLNDNCEDVRDAFETETLMVGTVDTYLLWHYTGGVLEGSYVTDVSNASRTLLMDISTQTWCPALISFFALPPELINLLPTIVSNSEHFGTFKNSHPYLEGKPICGLVGDQQSSLIGNLCLSPGEYKNTYGTGCFMLCNVGVDPVWSHSGLVTTAGYRLGSNAPTMYALEGSVAVAGSSVQWVKHNLGLIKTSGEIGELASQVEDTGGVYFVTAFSGLFAPYWDHTATGLMVGLTAYTTKHHIARATLEATCFQTKAILEAMEVDQVATRPFIPGHSHASSTVSTSSADSSHASSIVSLSSSLASCSTTSPITPRTPCDGPGFTEKPGRTMEDGTRSQLKKLKVDGGMSANDVLLQLQADISGLQVERSEMQETTALGAALLAGHAIGLFGWDLSRPDTLKDVNLSGREVFKPSTTHAEREERYKCWNRAVTKSKGWFEEEKDVEDKKPERMKTPKEFPKKQQAHGLLDLGVAPDQISKRLQAVQNCV